MSFSGELGRSARDRVVLQRARLAQRAHLVPVLLEADHPQVLPEAAEAVHVAVAVLAPVDEFHRQLVGAVGGFHEFGLVDAGDLVEALDHRDGRLADADDADRFGIDEADLVAPAQRRGQRGGRHPPGGAAADDHDGLDVLHF
jgi:hypothetical protein